MKTQKSFFEQSGGTYTQFGDVLLPDLTFGGDGQQPIGKYGRMRKRYLILTPNQNLQFALALFASYFVIRLDNTL